MLNVTGLLAELRRLQSFGQRTLSGRLRFWWPGFVLLLTVGICVLAANGMTWLSAVLLITAMMALGWFARQWPAMQISVVSTSLLYLLISLFDVARQFQAVTTLAVMVLLVVILLLSMVLESGKSPLTQRHVGLAGWMVIVACVLAILLDWPTRLTTEMVYADLPFSHVYPVLLSVIVVMVFLYLVFLRNQTRLPGSFVALLPAVLLGLFVSSRYFMSGISQQFVVAPVMEHALMLVHVPAMLLAFGLLMSCGGFALLRLLLDCAWIRHRQNVDILETVQIGLDDYLYRQVVVAIIVLGVGLLSGLVWSDLAWGHYWQWQAKQAMTMACWVYYLAGLHLRLQKGLQARPFAWWCVAGVPMLLIILIGTNLWPQGLHVFGGL